VITFVTTIAGTVAEFNETAFTINLAGLIEGDSPTDIDLGLTPASVIVNARITPRDDATATRTVEVLYAKTQQPLPELSQSLGVTVVSAQAATTESVVVTDPNAAGALVVVGENLELNEPLPGGSIAGIAIGGFFGCICLVICCYCAVCVRKRRKKPPPPQKYGSNYNPRASQTGQQAEVNKAFGALVNQGPKDLYSEQSYYRVPLPPEPTLVSGRASMRL